MSESVILPLKIEEPDEIMVQEARIAIPKNIQRALFEAIE